MPANPEGARKAMRLSGAPLIVEKVDAYGFAYTERVWDELDPERPRIIRSDKIVDNRAAPGA
ncbi:MAG: hypothetical protein AAFR84_01270 [Pseudomonadota bacterium]